MATALAFAFRTGDERNLVLFALAVALVVILVMAEPPRWRCWRDCDGEGGAPAVASRAEAQGVRQRRPPRSRTRDAKRR